jgi:hypothetical protein
MALSYRIGAAANTARMVLYHRMTISQSGISRGESHGWSDVASISQGIRLRRCRFHRTDHRGADCVGTAGRQWRRQSSRAIVRPDIHTGDHHRVIARRAKTAWSTMKIAVIYILILVAAVILLAAGKVRPHPP